MHPKMYSELLRRIKSKLKLLATPSHSRINRADMRERAEEWCETLAMDTKTAILRITGWIDYESFHEKFRDQLSTAQERAENCPVKMGGRGNLELIYQLTECIQATRVVETGVAYGWSSLAFLLSLQHRDRPMLVSTDMPYLKKGSRKYVGLIVPPDLMSMWKIIKYPDRDAIPQALKIMPVVDICHYDSDKSYEGKLWTYSRLWNVLRLGGIFISDDVGDDLAFRDFCHFIDHQPVITRMPATGGSKGTKYVGIVVKESNRTEEIHNAETQLL